MKKLIERPNISENLKVASAYQKLEALIQALEEKELSNETVDLIDNDVAQLNSITSIDKDLMKATVATQNRIIKLVEKRHKIVPIKYYRKLWMVLGMSAFGIPLGVAFGLSVGNLGMLGIGLPIGMAMGVGVGSTMDKKALNEGRQLNFEVK